MGYFKINIDNDITYLLDQIGYNYKVNNVPAKAIINNTSMERTYDDKRIITYEELKRGYYVEYNNLFFIVLNEINDKRYNSYYKGIIRRCNFDVNFVIEDRLYLFYSIIEGDKFFITEGSLVDISTDTLSVTLPYTSITKKIKKLDAFIKWGRKWNIEGIDYSKDGLVILHCKLTPAGVPDDVENEIASRWKEIDGKKVDKLNGDITPILPFDEVEEPEEPTDPEEPPIEPEEPEEPEKEITYSMTIETPYADDDPDELWYGETYEYIIQKFVDGEVVEGDFTFELSNDDYATISETTNKSCKVTAKDIFMGGNVTLIVTDVETGEIAIEKEIRVEGM